MHSLCLDPAAPVLGLDAAGGTAVRVFVPVPVRVAVRRRLGRVWVLVLLRRVLDGDVRRRSDSMGLEDLRKVAVS